MERAWGIPSCSVPPYILCIAPNMRALMPWFPLHFSAVTPEDPRALGRVSRSARVQHAQQSPEELLEFELGQFLVEGRCPRCGEEVGGGREQHQAHLEGCSGRELPKRERGAAPARRDVEVGLPTAPHGVSV